MCWGGGEVRKTVRPTCEAGRGADSRRDGGRPGRRGLPARPRALHLLRGPHDAREGEGGGLQLPGSPPARLGGEAPSSLKRPGLANGDKHAPFLQREGLKEVPGEGGLGLRERRREPGGPKDAAASATVVLPPLQKGAGASASTGSIPGFLGFLGEGVSVKGGRRRRGGVLLS